MEMPKTEESKSDERGKIDFITPAFFVPIPFSGLIMALEVMFPIYAGVICDLSYLFDQLELMLLLTTLKMDRTQDWFQGRTV